MDRERTHLVAASIWGKVTDDLTNADELSHRCSSTKRIVLGASGQSGSSLALVAIPLTRVRETFGVLQLFFNNSESAGVHPSDAFEIVGDLASPIFLRSLIYERNLAKANLDPLTNLANVRAFQSACEKIIADANRDGRTFSIVVFDIDNFKELNLTRGHISGDDVLRAIAKIAHNGLREMDLIARAGDDEFLLLLPSASEEDTAKIITRINSGIREEASSMPALRNIELKFGSAIYGVDSDEASALLTRARLKKNLSKKQSATRNVSIFPTKKRTGLNHLADSI
jgi:diguanylate cyclase (GGDEF)-like protein